MKKPNPKKAEKYEAKGDKCASKERFEKAMKHYRKALEHDSTKQSLYDKLIKTRDLLPGDWNEKDFAESVNWAMKKQEIENPSMKQIHAKLTPEWQRAWDKALLALASNDAAETDRFVEELVAMGETGTRAVVALLMELKNASTQRSEGEQEGSQPEKQDI